MRIGKVKGATEKRPETHTFNSNTGKYFFGSDASIHDVIMPEMIGVTKEVIYCQVRKEEQVDYKKEMQRNELKGSKS